MFGIIWLDFVLLGFVLFGLFHYPNNSWAIFLLVTQIVLIVRNQHIKEFHKDEK